MQPTTPPEPLLSPALSSPPALPPSYAALVAQHPSRSVHEHFDAYLLALHSFLSSFTYKSSPGPEHTPDIQSIKAQPIRAICQTAQRIVRARLPLKCLEATVVALHLSFAIPPHASYSLTRMPLRFLSTCAGHRYWHIVLALQLTWEGFGLRAERGAGAREGGWASRWAAISLSRHPPLGLCGFVHPSLSSLCTSLHGEYQVIGHAVLRLTVGLPVNEDERSRAPLHWHFLSLDLPKAAHSTRPQPSEGAQGEAEDEAEAEGEELQVGATPVVDSEAEQAEWKVVRGVLDRYALRASALLQRMRLNGRSPSTARPLPPLHPLVHWEPRSQQLQYTGRKARQGREATDGKSRQVAGGRVEASRSRTPTMPRDRFGV